MKKIILLLLLLPSLALADSGTFPRYIGIPDPGVLLSWDVTTLYGPGSGATYIYADDGGETAYRLNRLGEPYSYFADSDDADCTDTANPYGWDPEVDGNRAAGKYPRCNRPNRGSCNVMYGDPIPAGTVIEMHGAHGGFGAITCSGTSAAPIFYRGTASDKPVIAQIASDVQGSYLVFENIEFDMNQGTNSVLYWGNANVGVTHIAVRDCEIHNGDSTPTSSFQAMRMKIDTVELMPNVADQTFASASAWADVDLASGGGSYDETANLSLVAGAAGNGDYCTLPVASFPTTIGETYRLTLDASNLTGTWVIKSFDGTQTIGTISTSAAWQVFDWTAETEGGLRIVAGANDAVVDLDNFYLGDRPEGLIQNVLFWNNYCHDIGEDNSGDSDASCFSVDANSRYIWVLGNRATRIGGDMAQAAYDGFRYGGYIPQYIYFAGNESSHMYENMIDLKLVQDVIISQNYAHDFGPAYSTITKDGNMPFRAGLGEGPSGIDKNNIWFLYNRAYNMDPPGSHCVFNLFDYDASQTPYGPRYATSVYFIGNIIENYGTSTNDGFGFCFNSAKVISVLNNVAYNGDTAFYCNGNSYGTAAHPSEAVVIANNIVHTTDVDTFFFRANSGSFDAWTVKNNIFYSSDTTNKYTEFNISAVPVSLANLAAFCALFDGADDGDDLPDFCDAATVATDPAFVAGNFMLQSSSPAIAAGSSTELLAAQAAFYARYGIFIAGDFTGVPWGSAIDIGAYKYLPTKVRISNRGNPVIFDADATIRVTIE